jgi:cyclopropane-fatty-acyl-phospholipid synthase
MQWALELAERGWLADPLVRWGIRRRLERRRREIHADPHHVDRTVDVLAGSPVAIATERANAQHYELPSEYFELLLGPRLKYSCCHWSGGVTSLAEAENAALELACKRAQITDGMQVLDLGCGWGSLALWIAERYRDCRVTAVSNSTTQGAFIRSRARSLGLRNLDVKTRDINRFEIGVRFDRVVSIEMFEHVRNHALLLQRIAGWLEADGKLFVHHFCHAARPYLFETRSSDDWMARYFFTGGLMPSEDLLDRFAGPVQLEQRWRVHGQHYEKTLLAWLANLDRHRARIAAIFAPVYGADAGRWLQRWRIFLLACAESFGYGDGEEWFVSHSLWSRDDRSSEGPGSPT